ncbi:MAG TPA: hypothetical protein PK280_16775, partial [Planctomycetota bacterium]|nr:hypothetical protein [Planctomycetota bacterium]
MAEDPRNPARVPDASPSVPPQPRRSRLAVIALILGINSLLCLMSMNVLPDFLPFVGLLTLPLSFILGVAAMIVIYASKKRLSGIWMALGGLAFALVTTFLFVLYPTIRKVHDHARANVCRGNLRQIGAACRAYASDNQDWMP